LIENIPEPILTKNLRLIVLKKSSAGIVLDYYLRNRESFKIWEPLRPESFYTIKHHKSALKSGLQKVKAGREYRFLIFENEDIKYKNIIGVLTFSSIVKGPFLSCFVGYSIDNVFQNKGYMTQALQAGIDFIFNIIGLHRIEANIMPKNKASLKVVSKLGFENEGFSPKYLKINGEWEDHVHMVLRNQKQE
jgi:ribosomal-protein-alanine N-acetyltransferase